MTNSISTPPTISLPDHITSQPDSLEEILLKGSYVSEADLKKAVEYLKKNKSTLEDYLLNQGLLTPDLLGQAMAETHSLPYADLNSKIPTKEQVLKLPKEIAISNRLILFEENDNAIVFTTDKPEVVNNLTPQLSTLFPNKKISFAYSLGGDIDHCLEFYKQPLSGRFETILTSPNKIAPQLVTEIIKDALSEKASDIHFDPQDKQVVIRLRIDGQLRNIGQIDRILYENVLNHIKILSHLRIDEHFSAQDGAMRFPKDDSFIDMRISIAPTIDGEKVAIRLLAEYIKGFGYADLGISTTHQEILTKAIKQPFGMILVTGPTGSGKTTTLYSLLKTLNTSETNITTIEDPVEYKILGVNQIQVNPLTNLTFAKGLKSIVRQDPNVILVGEIRDLETAEIAINAALTGHLLLSTFHANDAATSIPRLLDMGAEPFLLASTLNLIIAQRLVRRLCNNCRISYQTTNAKLEATFPQAQHYFPNKGTTLYQAKGCDNCGGTGFKGRTAIFEFLKITPKLEEIILTRPSTQVIHKQALIDGSKSLFEDGLEKVQTGITTIEELLRVAIPPSNGKPKS